MTQILRHTKFLGFPVSQRRTPSVRSFFLQMEMLKTECWLGTSKNTSTSPAAVSSLPGSELAGHDKALGRLSPGSLGGKGIDALSAEARAALLSGCERCAQLLKNPWAVMYKTGLGARSEPLESTSDFQLQFSIKNKSGLLNNMKQCYSEPPTEKSEVDFADRKTE